jgi:hypothetical protein
MAEAALRIGSCSQWIALPARWPGAAIADHMQARRPATISRLSAAPMRPDGRRRRAITGSIVTQVMTDARDRRAQRVAFLKQQLEQFCGPLLAARREIGARSELLVKVQALDDPSSCWRR